MIKMDTGECIFLMEVDFKVSLWKTRCMAQEPLWWETEEMSTASGKITSFLKSMNEYNRNDYIKSNYLIWAYNKFN